MNDGYLWGDALRVLGMLLWREGAALTDISSPSHRASSVSSGARVGGCDAYAGVGGSGVLRDEGIGVAICIVSPVTALRSVTLAIVRPCSLDVS